MPESKEILKKLLNNEDSNFSEIIKAALLDLNKSELELSEILKTSKPTIERWRDGNTIPHELIKESVKKTLIKILS